MQLRASLLTRPALRIAFPAGGWAVNKPEKLPADDNRETRPVFVSYATADRKQALAVAKAIERRGVKCWISSRDVPPGANYQEAIVHSLRTARAMVLIFSDAANNSEEIKKELSLASRFRIPLMALRIEDVEPSDAFAYELSTRQWIDAFEGWDRSIDALVGTLRVSAPLEPVTEGVSRDSPAPSRRTPSSRRPLALAASVVVLMLLAGFAISRLVRPTPTSTHTMLVRLAGFQVLSPDLPATMPQSLNEEMIDAFTTNGVVGVSTASTPPRGTAPAYALSGSLRRDADKVKFIATMTDERSGMTLWSHSYDYDAADLTRIPHWAAVDASWVARCGLFAVSTYPKTLPDQTLANYLDYCSQDSATKSLDIAHKIVASTPDFSWGWSAVEISALESMRPKLGGEREQLRQEALKAAAEAVRLDPSNSEAYAYKNYLVDQGDLVAREALVKQGIGARPLACGCEHHFYGNVMMEVGRVEDAVIEYRRGVDVLPLNGSTQIALAEALIADGKPEQAKQHFDAAVDMVDDATLRDQITIMSAPLTGKYDGVDKALANPKLEESAAMSAAIAKAVRAMHSQDSGEKASAVEALTAVPPADGGRLAVALLGALGANQQALHNLEALSFSGGPRIWLWYPSMRGALRDPTFPSVAQRLGLMHYWKATHTKPDVCSDKDAPPFCRMI